MRIPNLIAIALMALTVLILQGCGRKGSLFMEASKPAPAAQLQAVQPLAIPAQSQPVPSATLQNQPEPKK